MRLSHTDTLELQSVSQFPHTVQTDAGHLSINHRLERQFVGVAALRLRHLAIYLYPFNQIFLTETQKNHCFQTHI